MKKNAAESGETRPARRVVKVSRKSLSNRVSHWKPLRGVQGAKTSRVARMAVFRPGHGVASGGD
jgi:hypothetical protein